MNWTHTAHQTTRPMKTIARLLLATALAASTLPTRAADSAVAAAMTRCSTELGQQLIEQGRYERAIREFTCIIENEPTGVEGYRGRIEAQLMLGRYSDALADYARITAFVVPVHPEATDTILAGYAARLAAAPNDVRALTGASFARWARFEYPAAIHLLNQLLAVRPNDVYGNLLRGSSRLLKGVTRNQGIADIERALALAPDNAHARFIVADAYTYGLPDPQRALAEATLALNGGLDTPRIRAILATSYGALGDPVAEAVEIERHIEMVTTALVPAAPLVAGTTLALDLVPGRTYDVPLPVIAGQPLSVTTGSDDFWDTILVVLAPDGTPVLGSDDDEAYFAAFEWTAPATGTYRILVTSFESINTGVLKIARD